LLSQTILVLEDDAPSRFVLNEILERGGYKVLSSASLSEAISVCRTHRDRIELLIADVVLRGDGGSEGVRELKFLQPAMAILFLSGYPLELLENRGLVEKINRPGERTEFLQKPFTAQALLNAVRRLIGQTGEPPRDAPWI
jgi:two-component system, cell cycle sensor histidine kinase and response regulator CckA